MDIFKGENKQSGGTIILLVMLMLSSILLVTLTAAEIVRMGVRMGTMQLESTKAYFAAEAGIEWLLWDIRKNPSDTFNPNTECVVDQYYNFAGGCAAAETDKNFSNGTIDYILYASSTPKTIFRSYGAYGDMRRAVEIRY